MKQIGFDFICIDPLGNKFIVHRGFDEIINGIRPLSHNGIIQRIESMSIISENKIVYNTADDRAQLQQEREVIPIEEHDPFNCTCESCVREQRRRVNKDLK